MMTLKFDFFPPRIFRLVLAGLGTIQNLSSTEGTVLFIFLLYISLQLGFCTPKLPQLGSLSEASSIHKAFSR